jgi:hypothetical protein
MELELRANLFNVESDSDSDSDSDSSSDAGPVSLKAEDEIDWSDGSLD